MTTDPTPGAHAHPTDLELAAWCDEPESAPAHVGPHVAGCDPCRAELGELAAARAAVALDPPMPTPEAFAAQRERIVAALATRREGRAAVRIAWLAPLAAAAAIAAFVLVDRTGAPESRDSEDAPPRAAADAAARLPLVADAAAAAEQAAVAIDVADESAEATVVPAEAIDDELLDAAFAAAEPLAPPIAVERSLTTELLFAELPEDEQSAVLMEMASADLDF